MLKQRVCLNAVSFDAGNNLWRRWLLSFTIVLKSVSHISSGWMANSLTFMIGLDWLIDWSIDRSIELTLYLPTYSCGSNNFRSEANVLGHQQMLLECFVINDTGLGECGNGTWTLVMKINGRNVNNFFILLSVKMTKWNQVWVIHPYNKCTNLLFFEALLSTAVVLVYLDSNCWPSFVR